MKFEYPRLVHSAHLFLCLSSVCGIILLATAQAPAGPRPGPGCQAKCGDVDIPFPFGIGKECALDGFHLMCNDSKPFKGDFEVVNFNVPDGKIRVKTAISSQCYNTTTNVMHYSDASSIFTDSVFWVSEKENKIIVIGCNTLAYMISSSYVIGCVSTCADKTPESLTCSGAGCCQADVPKDIREYRALFNTDYNTTTYSGCAYMALMEEAALNFDPSFVTSGSTKFSDKNNGKVPVVLNWKIQNITCDVATKNTSTYACVSSNSACLNSTNEPGYLCKCLDGYRGNPYITDGCQDIDECHDENADRCRFGLCENTPGNYTCSCYPGNYLMGGVCVPAASSFPEKTIAGTTVGLVIFVIAVACACLIRERRKLQNMKQNYFRQHGGLILFEEMKSKQGVTFKIFTEEELQQATNRFSEQQVLGQGGHGTVYKGLLKSDVEVAVKRCTTIDEQQKKEFGREMLILSQINHKNVVKLLGCCLEVQIPMLVYEFVPNGTLFDLIHGNHGGHISFDTRLAIAHESADALAYLHSSASTPIIHGDGTCGYLDPEYMQTCLLTDKSDVYSFGVVLLELLTGKKPFNFNPDAPEHEKSLSMMFMCAMKENKLEEVLDDQIKNEGNMEFLEEIAELAKQCLDICGENRPSMKEVVEKLDRVRKVMQHPWAQQNPEETESLLGERSNMASSTGISAESFSIEIKTIMGMQSGR
ncbi:hypothetical protein BRADI_4g32830v3 [Brachypodium distachyon]|uniref:Protein kinase domain-containing protein n=1 Tax=Brachypodium distachyon TaxID=15368 RepID=A0A2K2CRX0_BRADI|nr:hypothetical protein BRADI_4g32830v3 [Brachypodium distachyon]